MHTYIHVCVVVSLYGDVWMYTVSPSLSPSLSYARTRTHAHTHTHTHTHTNEYRAELHGHRMLAVECEILELLLLLTFCNGKLGFIH